jgi:NAD(P)H-dependent FMN reductase
LLEAAARLVPAGLRVRIYDELALLPPFNPDLDEEGEPPPAAVARLRALISASDALIVSSPEYAHGVPGVLKNALDWLVSYPDFAGKPVLLLNASGAGGAHAQASLAETLRTMSARVLPESLTEPFLRRRLASADALDEAAAATLRKALLALTRR